MENNTNDNHSIKYIAVFLIITVLIIVVMVRMTTVSKVKIDNLDNVNNTATITNPVSVDVKDDKKLIINKDKNMEQIAKNGDILVMNYTGKLSNGTAFDSNVDPKFGHVQPFQFTLGAGQVIKGWDEGLLGMKVGEKKTLTIPPEKAYGVSGIGNTIPPNATLIFDVELVAIK